MWPFKKRSKSDIFLELLPKVEAMASERWMNFRRTLIFKEDVGLQEQFMFFLQPMLEGIRIKFPQLSGSPDAALFLAVVKGIARSGTVSKADLAASLNLPVEALE